MNNMFLKIGDKDNPIKGESTDKTGKNLLNKDGHVDWIEVLSFHEGVTQPASTLVGSKGNRTIERTQHDEFTVTKYIDLATPLIHQWCCMGNHIDKVILEVFRADAYATNNESLLYMAYIMKDCVIARHEVDGRTGELPIETVKFKYGLIYTRYIPQAETAGPYKASPVGGGWDVIKNEPASSMP